MKRRTFLQNISHSAAGVALSSFYWNRAMAATDSNRNQPIPKRPYNAEIDLSIIGFGGIVLVKQSQKAGNREVARAVERGINYFDVAPTYGKGEAEQKLGVALKPYRDSVFLAEKTQKRDAKGAAEELENSLKVLKTDHFDLYQLHAMKKMEDVEKVLGPGGAMETFVKAREAGKVRYLGFSAHDEEVALELLDRFDWDSVLYPINFVCFAQGNFGPRLIQKAKEKNVARLALKALAYTPWESKEEKAASNPKCWYRPLNDAAKAQAALRFTLSQEITAAIPPGDERIYRMAENMAATIKPMSRNEQRDLLASTQGLKPIFETSTA